MADIYIRVGPGASNVRGAGPPRIPWIHLMVEGPNDVLNIMVPTCSPDLLDTEYFAHWIPTIQGPIPTRCGATADQRHALLCVALACHGFLSGWPGVEQDGWYILIARLTEVALSLEADERANDHLQEIVEWLEGLLPQDLLEGPHVPPVDQEPFENPLVVQLPPRGPILPLQWGPQQPVSSSTVFNSGLSAAQDDDMPPLLDDDDYSSGSVFEGTWESARGR